MTRSALGERSTLSTRQRSRPEAKSRFEVISDKSGAKRRRDGPLKCRKYEKNDVLPQQTRRRLRVSHHRQSRSD